MASNILIELDKDMLTANAFSGTSGIPYVYVDIK